jgi:uncharacterized membrane protein
MKLFPRESQPRPVLQLPRTPIELALETISAIVLVYVILLTVLSWSSLPEHIPTQFGISGVPDSWGSKSWLALLPAISVTLYAAMTIIRNYPQNFNYPKPVTPENAESRYRSALHMIAWLKFEIMVVFTYIQTMTIAIAGGGNISLGFLFIPCVAVLIPGTIVFYMIQLMKEE